MQNRTLMHKCNIFYSFWFLLLHTNLSSPSLLRSLSPSLSPWPSQNSNEIKWSLICMHLQNIACAVFAIKGMEKRVAAAVVLVGVYVLPHWHQTVFWYGNGGQGKNGCSLRLCLDIGQGLYSRLSFFLSLLFSFYSFPHRGARVLCWRCDLSSLLLYYSIPAVTVDLCYQQCPGHFEPCANCAGSLSCAQSDFFRKNLIFEKKKWLFFPLVCVCV